MKIEPITKPTKKAAWTKRADNQNTQSYNSDLATAHAIAISEASIGLYVNGKLVDVIA